MNTQILKIMKDIEKLDEEIQRSEMTDIELNNPDLGDGIIPSHGKNYSSKKKKKVYSIIMIHLNIIKI